jgi:glycosyltransferase involved in cell wall biosynthesis
MESKPLVSAICPTFSRPRYLLHAVKLFAAQTWKRAELIVLDDSPPALRPDLSSFANVRHVKLSDRLTIGAKHTMGHQLGQGDVFAYWDDDDWFNPVRLVRQLDPIVRQTADVVGFRRNYVLTAGETSSWFKINPGRLEARFWIGNGATDLRIPIHDGSAVYTRKAAELGTHPEQTMNEKVGFLNSVASLKWASIENRDLFVYVRHGKNTWKYSESIVHEATERPWWFPRSESEFYRKGVA